MQAEKLQAMEALRRECSGCRSRRPLGVDRSCQAGDVGTPANEEGERNDPRTRVDGPSCGIKFGDSTFDETGVVASVTTVEEEADRRIAAAVAQVATAEARATAWAHAFSSATQLIHAALVSLCEDATGVWGADGDGYHVLGLPILERVETAGENGMSAQTSSAVVPWVPGKLKAEATTAVVVLRDSVESAVGGVRLALARHAARTAPPASTVAAVSLTTTGSQTEEEAKKEKGQEGEAVNIKRCAGRQRTVGVQVDDVGGRCTEGVFGAGGSGGAGGAPAWEGGKVRRCSEGHNRDDNRQRQWQREDTALVGELRRKLTALSEALQRAEVEKRDLVWSLTGHFEVEKVHILGWAGL